MAENKKYDFPTEVIALPSQGKCYPENHPLASGEVEIKYMTAKEEEILSSQNLTIVKHKSHALLKEKF